MKPELRPHQLKALEKLSNGKILCGDVGSGKTMVAAAYYAQKEAPKDVYVFTTAKKRDSLDWDQEFVRFGVGKSQDATLSGVLTVDSWNNIDKYRDVKGAFLIFDEQRLVGKGKWVKAFIHMAKSNNWILLSATPGDTWVDYIPVFIANGFYKNRTAFTREHVVYNTYAKFPKVDRYLGTGKLLRLRNSLLVEMPFERHTTRHLKRVVPTYDEELYKRVVKDRWHVYEERPLRDVAELFSVMRKVVNSDSSRLEALCTLLQTHPRLIVFYNFDYELEMLRTLCQPLANTDPTPSIHTQCPCLGQSKQCKSGLTGRWACDSKTSGVGSSLPTSESSDRSQLSERTSTGSRSTSNGTPTNTPSSEKSPRSIEPVTPAESTTASENARNGRTESTISERRNESWKKKSGPSSTLCTETGPKTKTGVSGSTDTTSSSTSGVGLRSTSTATDLKVAEWNGHKHEPVPKTDRWVYLVQYTAGAEGWNCITTNATVFFSLNYSYKLLHQAQGRIDRLNTPYEDLYYYIFRSEASIDSMIWKSLSQKKSFNESSVMRKDEF